jgi:hypothetical protein
MCLGIIPTVLANRKIKELLNPLDDFMKAARKASEIANKAIFDQIKDLQPTSFEEAETMTEQFFADYFYPLEDRKSPYVNDFWRAMIPRNIRSISDFADMPIEKLELISNTFKTKLIQAQDFARALGGSASLRSGFIQFNEHSPVFELANWEEAAKRWTVRS